ncbi:MAG: hypothetical protein L6R28_12220 [Planctomycetes bacterium]|nr:hypothetical protein [Planctomycetota bacterium]
MVQFWDLKDGQQLGRPMSRGYGASSYAGETADYWWIERDSFKQEGGDIDIWIKGSSSLIATLRLGEFGPLEKVIGKAGGLYKIDRDWQSNPRLCRLSRPAFWYGFLWLPEFYLTLALELGLAWSVWRDRKL